MWWVEGENTCEFETCFESKSKEGIGTGPDQFEEDEAYKYLWGAGWVLSRTCRIELIMYKSILNKKQQISKIKRVYYFK